MIMVVAEQTIAGLCAIIYKTYLIIEYHISKSHTIKLPNGAKCPVCLYFTAGFYDLFYDDPGSARVKV